jgi:hypothetical protein
MKPMKPTDPRNRAMRPTPPPDPNDPRQRAMRATPPPDPNDPRQRAMRSAPAPDPAAPRRQHQRRDMRMSAEIRTARSVFTATTRDLSEGGAGLDCDRPLTDSEEITIGLFLVVDDVEAETPPMWVKGRVAWSRAVSAGGFVAGVQFAVLTDAQRGWLRQVLREIDGTGEPSIPISL